MFFSKCLIALATAAATTTTSAFVVPTKHHVGFASTTSSSLAPSQKQHEQQQQQQQQQQQSEYKCTTLSMASAATDDENANNNNNNKKVVVISPPGGLGEITAVSTAKNGGSVRWFVVSSGMENSLSSQKTSKFSLPEETLSAITAAGGSFDIAGADAQSLLLSSDQPGSAMAAVGKWCGPSDAIICTADGVEEETTIVGVKRDREVFAKEAEARKMMNDAVKVAAREAAALVPSSNGGGVRVVLQPLVVEGEGEGKEEEKGGGGLLKNLLGGGNNVPSSLIKALEESGSGGNSKVIVLRHGDLFGVPESSSEASPFVGGPRRDPILRDEITMRSIRLDPTVSVYGTTLKGDNKRSSRLSMGEAAALVSLSSVLPSSSSSSGLDLTLSSFPGIEELSTQDWKAEFERVMEVMSSPGGAYAELFSSSFASIPSKTRLADWLATKWAPAILRTYDIAGIRVGARPVFAARVGDSSVEIVWQKLVDFQTVTVGKMIIDVTEDDCIVARRGAGDKGAGYGEISSKPLAGEDVLVGRLADASSQAVEKGLATKATTTKKEKVMKKEMAVPKATSTVAASGTVAAPAGGTTATKPTSRETGPRTAGARRSAERKRGKRRTPKTDGADTSSSDSFQ